MNLTLDILCKQSIYTKTKNLEGKKKNKEQNIVLFIFKVITISIFPFSDTEKRMK